MVADDSEVSPQVLDQVRTNREHQLGRAARAIDDRRQEERGGVQDGTQRADPGFVAVRGAEIGEDRIGEVTIEHLGGPLLPVPEEAG